MKKINKISLALVIAMVLILGVSKSLYATTVNATVTTINTITTTNSSNVDNTNVSSLNVSSNDANTDNATANNIVVENDTTNEVIPDTGKNDKFLLVLIGIFAISSIYTYCKVRKYNI